MKRRLLVVTGVMAIAFISYLAFTIVDSKTSIATAAKKTYSAVAYVAGHGGHFAKADVTIDPNNAENPLKINSLDRTTIGTSKTHPMHDVRIDSNDSNIAFYSTYILDPQGKMHVGKTDLKADKVIKDVAVAPDAKAPGKKPPLYCASGQGKHTFMPVFMGTEGYVDVFDKATLDHKHRMFVSDIPDGGYKAGNYKFVHGTNSPDMKKFLIAINQAAEGKGNGKIDLIMVDLPALEKGQWKVLAKNTISGEPDKTITFRQAFSRDGKLIFQSANDRAFVIDAATLKLVDQQMSPAGEQIHDMIPTPDAKYALLTVRDAVAPCGSDGMPLKGEGVKNITDGLLMVYDADAKKIIGKGLSVCQGCHKGMGLGDKTAILCGIDTNWKK